MATTDLKPGQLIFNELPMIIGPRQLTKPVCLGCHVELKDPKKVYNCSRLGTSSYEKLRKAVSFILYKLFYS